MRYVVDVPAADWPTLPVPGELVAELTSGAHAQALTVVSAAYVGERVRLELDAPGRSIGLFTGEPIPYVGKEHSTVPLATGNAFSCEAILNALPEITGA